jgi:peptidoglycan/LPS O-acetylase OafA/YrhL
VFGHARGDVFTVRGLDPAGSGLLRLLLLPASFAQEAVAVFFVLSGYLVGGQVLRQARADRFDWRVYVAKRLSRLWTVLLPGLVLTALVDAVSRQIDAGRLASLQAVHGDGVGQGLCNAAFLMPTRCLEFGSNESLWSLAYEFWFYVLFAGLTIGWYAARRGRRLIALVNLAVAVGSVALFGVELLVLFPAWLIGVVVAEVQSRSPRRDAPVATVWRQRAGWAGALALLGAAFLASNLFKFGDGVRELVIGLATVPLVWLCLRTSSVPDRGWFRAGEWLGSWSYSLYVFHRPLVVLVVVASSGWWGDDPRASTLALYLIAAVVAAAVYPLYRLTEHHTDRMRALALRLVGRAPGSGPRHAAPRHAAGAPPAGSTSVRAPSPADPA